MKMTLGPLLALSILFHFNGLATAGSFTILNHPDATSGTIATGIWGNNVVGYFYGDAGVRGFLYDGSTYTTLTVPGSHQTYAHGISGTTIVGQFHDDTGVRSFSYDGSTFTTINVPGADVTYVNGIFGNRFVGEYTDSAGSHGFVLDGTTLISLDKPGATYTSALGASGSAIVGRYSNGKKTKSGVPSYRFDGSSYSDLRDPDGESLLAEGIFDNVIVGSVGVKGPRGFISDGSAYTTFNVPGASVTVAQGIYERTVVGHFSDDAGVHGFIYTFDTIDAPEPTSLALMGLGIASMVGFRWRGRKQSAAA